VNQYSACFIASAIESKAQKSSDDSTILLSLRIDRSHAREASAASGYVQGALWEAIGQEQEWGNG
jgi:hypothetical protein